MKEKIKFTQPGVDHLNKFENKDSSNNKEGLGRHGEFVEGIKQKLQNLRTYSFWGGVSMGGFAVIAVDVISKQDMSNTHIGLGLSALALLSANYTHKIKESIAKEIENKLEDK